MTEVLKAECRNKDCPVPNQHGHAYGMVYYGRPDQLRQAWQASRRVKNRELRQIAFEKIHAHILDTNHD